jgi:hypothetical protein
MRKGAFFCSANTEQQHHFHPKAKDTARKPTLSLLPQLQSKSRKVEREGSYRAGRSITCWRYRPAIVISEKTITPKSSASLRKRETKQKPRSISETGMKQKNFFSAWELKHTHTHIPDDREDDFGHDVDGKQCVDYHEENNHVDD